MGLMYLFPVSEDETEHCKINISKKKITLKTYGLPYLFWGYAAAAFAVLLFLFIAGKAPLEKLFSLPHLFDQILAWSMASLFILVPLITLGFFFYEKIITKLENNLIITHKIFFLPIWKKTYQLSDNSPFYVEHFLDSPNVAKLQGLKDTKGFQNKGYFQLFFRNHQGISYFLDRHSRKADLEKMKNLLENN